MIENGPLIPWNDRQARLRACHLCPRNEQSINRKRLIKAALNQRHSLGPIVAPNFAELIIVLSIKGGRDEWLRQKRVQANRINIGENNTGLSPHHFKEMPLRDKLGGLAGWIGEMKSVPRLKSIGFHRVVTGAGRVTQTGRGKQNQDAHGSNGSLSHKNIFCCPCHG